MSVAPPQTRVARAVARSLPYWIEEFAIGYRAFSAATIYADTGWLAVQIAKEWSGSGVYGPTGADVRSAHADAAPDKLDEELAHHRMLTDLLGLMDAPPPGGDPHEPGRALVALRNRLWPDATARLAVAMSEGGGLGLFKGAMAAITARPRPMPQDAAVVACFDAIIADEAGHVATGFAAFAGAALTAEQEANIVDHLAAILALKVAERREQFAQQLAAAPLASPEVQELADYQRFVRDRFGDAISAP